MCGGEKGGGGRQAGLDAPSITVEFNSNVKTEDLLGCSRVNPIKIRKCEVVPTTHHCTFSFFFFWALKI